MKYKVYFTIFNKKMQCTIDNKKGDIQEQLKEQLKIVKVEIIEENFNEVNFDTVFNKFRGQRC